MELTPDMVSYLGIMSIVTGYIAKWLEHDPAAEPEPVADFIWTGANMPFKGQDKKRLLDMVEIGYDSVIARAGLKDIIDAFNQFPNYSEEQKQVFMEVAQLTGIMRQEDLPMIQTVDDLAPYVDEFRKHMNVQLSPEGREWICRFLNKVALRAGKPAPHPEFMKGATPQKGGRDNL